MKATASKPASPIKPSPKLKALAPRKDPKGGGKNRPPGCDEWGCGMNHNEVPVAEGAWTG